MSDFIANAAAIAASPLTWLQDKTQQGKQAWLGHRFPTRKTENWKYTNLRALEQGDYLRAANIGAAPEALPQHLTIAGLEAVKLVFVNGQFVASLSDDLALANVAGLELTLFSNASDAQKKAINEQLGQLVNSAKYEFSGLNTAQLNDGVYINVAKNQQVAKPIHIVWMTTAQDSAFTVPHRLLVNLETGASACVIEQFVSGDEAQNSFTHSVSEFNVGENARLQHYRLQQEQEDAIHIGGVFVRLDRSADLDSFHMAFGSKIKRVDIEVQHQGEGSTSKINGVYLPKNNQHIDYHTCIEHAVPHCTSQETFRGIIADSAHAVFNGRIHIHPDAQKTLAELSNKNLLTSDKAQIDTKPELEIYADDVRCAHGATIAQLDEKSLNYLRTRGISLDEAQVMLSYGFINELINDVALEPIGTYLRPILANRFAKEPSLVRHIA